MDGDFAYLSYTFMVDTSSTWSSLNEFESSLADYFKAYGMEAEIMKTMEGQYCKRILLLKKAVEPVMEGIMNTNTAPVKESN